MYIYLSLSSEKQFESFFSGVFFTYLLMLWKSGTRKVGALSKFSFLRIIITVFFEMLEVVESLNCTVLGFMVKSFECISRGNKLLFGMCLSVIFHPF